jgi:hypothetical protein
MDDDGNPVAFLVGGIPDERLTRLIGLYLAYEANLLLSSSVFAFQHLRPVEDFWNELGELDAAAGVAECVNIYDEPSMRLAMGRSETDD